MIALRKWMRGKGLAQDQSGIAAVEFAMLLPVLLTLFIGSYETSGLLLAYLKLESAAETAADLVAQTNVNTVLTATNFSDFTNAVSQVMTPLSTTGLQIAYASVTYQGATPIIDWHTEVHGATPITIGNLPNGINSATMGTVGASSTDSIVVVQLTYPYTSPLSGYLNSNYTLVESAYNRPRYVSCVPTYLNTNSICP